MALPILTEAEAIAQGLDRLFTKSTHVAALDDTFPATVRRTALAGNQWPVAISDIFSEADGLPIRAAFMRPMTEAELIATADDRLRQSDPNAWVEKQMALLAS